MDAQLNSGAPTPQISVQTDAPLRCACGKLYQSLAASKQHKRYYCRGNTTSAGNECLQSEVNKRRTGGRGTGITNGTRQETWEGTRKRGKGRVRLTGGITTMNCTSLQRRRSGTWVLASTNISRGSSTARPSPSRTAAAGTTIVAC